MIDLKILIKNGVQFGHQAWRWSPKMARFIWGKKNGVHLIDVSKTAFELDRAAKFLESIAAEGKQILWVGTKNSAQDIIQEFAIKLKDSYVRNRWIGGTLTNFSQVKKAVTKLLHFEDVLSKTDQYGYTKKEFSEFQKNVDRLESNVGGIRQLSWPIGAIVVVDSRKEAVAIKEANAAGVPVVALVDTNNDPSGIDYVIPGNDDVDRAIRVIIGELADAVERGKAKNAQKHKEIEEKSRLAAALAAKEAQEKKQPVQKKKVAPVADVAVDVKQSEIAVEVTEDVVNEQVQAILEKLETEVVEKKAPKKSVAKKADK